MEADQEIYVTEIARFFPPQGKWTEEDYFALPESNLIVELSDGKLIVNPPATPPHQMISGNLYLSLVRYVENGDLGRVLYSPVSVRLWEGKIREPDLLFVRTEHLDRITNKSIDGAPAWVAEIISPSTRKADEVEKLAEYAEAGIPEYWLLDSKAVTIRIYVLPQGASEYVLHATYKAGEIARSVTLIGFEVAVDKIFPEQSEG